MVIFVLIFILLFGLALFDRKNDRLAFVTLILMCFVNAFRAISVGADTINYYNNQFYGEYSLDFSSTYELEWIFQSLSALIRDNGIDPRWCLYSLSIITSVFLYLSFKRYHKQLGTNLILILLFYFVFDFYSLSFNIARQCASISILLYAYSFLYSEKLRYFFFYVIIAAGFHISSLLFIFVYFIRKFDINKFKSTELIIVSYAILITIFIGKVYLWNFIISSYPALALYENLMGNTEIGSFSIFSLLLESFRLGLGLYVLVRLRQVGLNRYNTLLYFALLAVILTNSFYGNITRIFYGLSIIRVMAFATLFSRLRWSRNDKIVFMLSTLFYGIFTLSGLNNGAYEIVPYELDI